MNFKLKPISQSGFGLLETMFATAIISTSLMFLATLTENSMKASKSIEKKGDARTELENFYRVLEEPTMCSSLLANGQNKVPELPYAQFPEGNDLYVSDLVSGQGYLIEDTKFMQYWTVTRSRIDLMHSLGPTSALIRVHNVLESVAGQFIGSNIIEEDTKLIVSFNSATRVIESCGDQESSSMTYINPVPLLYFGGDSSANDILFNQLLVSGNALKSTGSYSNMVIQPNSTLDLPVETKFIVLRVLCKNVKGFFLDGKSTLPYLPNNSKPSIVNLANQKPKSLLCSDTSDIPHTQVVTIAVDMPLNLSMAYAKKDNTGNDHYVAVYLEGFQE